MEVTFRVGEKTRTVCFPPSGCVTVGRSVRADFHLEDMAVSLFHVELRWRDDPQGNTSLVVRDISFNGTGVVMTDRPEEEATPLAKGVDTAVQSGTGLIIPLRKPSSRAAEERTETLWVDIRRTEPLHRGGSSTPVLPTGDVPRRPTTWPKGWASLPASIQKIWIEEGIENAHDLANFYTTAGELDKELQGAGAPEVDRAMAAIYWKDARRASATARPSTPAVPPGPSPVVVAAQSAPLIKKVRNRPKLLNAPGLWHQQWMAREEQRRAKAKDAQGLNQARPEHLQEVWDIYLRAGRLSSLHREVREEEMDTLKSLLFKPIERYADSLSDRLAAWRRWEAWVSGQPGASPFRPTDLVVGKYLHGVDAGGPTAAGQAWHALKWWSVRLGLNLALDSPLVQDYRLKKPGHTTKQADVLTLDVVTRMRQEAEGQGTRATFASLVLLIAGGCVRFRHAQRSAVVEITRDLVMCRCSKGKRRQQGIREAFRWATPRCWRPMGDTAAKAVALIRDVAMKAKGYDEAPFLIPDLATTQGYGIDPGDHWLPRPMSYTKFVAILRVYVASLKSGHLREGITFNTLRRLMPTGADVLQFSDTVAAAIGNWQDTPKGASEKKRTRMRDQMAKRYAGEKVASAGMHKVRVVAAIWDVGTQPTDQEGDGWSRMRHRYPDKKALRQLAEKFRTDEDPQVKAEDIKCLPELPRGPLRHRPEEPVREVPALHEIAWLMQSAATGLQRPWVHFAARMGDKPFCRSTKFRRDPVRQGLGIEEAARTGERPCPRCVPLLGQKAPDVMAAFCQDGDGRCE